MRAVVDLVEARRALHERRFLADRSDRNANSGFAVIEVQVAVQPVGQLDQARGGVGIELLRERAVGDRRRARSGAAPKTRGVEDREPRAQREAVITPAACR